MRIRSLDGLRAVSILLVIVAHSSISLYRGSSRFPWLVASWGELGVGVFFGISGFIITMLLVKEHGKHGEIDLKAFYVRRAFRILPPLWVFVTAMVLVKRDLRLDQILRVLCFVTDYSKTKAWSLDHSWSLSVEEQFYLLWPFALWALAPIRGTKLAWGLLLASPAIRVGSHALGIPGALATAFHTIVDSLMIGCLLALLMDSAPEHWLIRGLRHGWVAACSWVFLLFGSPVLTQRFGGAYHAPLGLSLRALAVGSIIVWSLASEEGPIRKLLNSAPMVHVGLISYSLYLWQQPFFDPALAGTWLGWTPVAIAGAFLMAELSYRGVEQPMLSLRQRLMRPGPAPARGTTAVV
jgi:peptidoglycan/LPS O-acetylase OafA/YrhL